MPLVEFHYFGQILLAAALGSLLGLQRERWGKPAGPRTHALVAIGATMFTILSAHAFSNDASVAAQIVTGIGFLGAGLIIHRDDGITNLTTAAGLWAAAAMGMAVGVGYFAFATLATALMLLLFMFDDRKWRKNNTEDD